MSVKIHSFPDRVNNSNDDDDDNNNIRLANASSGMESCYECLFMFYH